MFEYFPNNYTWSLAVMSALNRGGQVSEIDEACRPLKEIAGIRAIHGDQTQQRAWFESWMKVAEHCGADNGPLVVDYMTDWAAEKLGGSPAGI